MTKCSIQEDLTIYAANTKTPRFIKYKYYYTSENLDSNTIIVGYFNTPLISLDKSGRQKISQETLDLN